MKTRKWKVVDGRWLAPLLALISVFSFQFSDLAQISWTPDTGTNWVLQERSDLSLGSWSNSPSGFTNPVVVPATLPTKFYRLNKP